MGTLILMISVYAYILITSGRCPALIMSSATWCESFSRKTHERVIQVPNPTLVCYFFQEKLVFNSLLNARKN